jgi:nicotinamide phosphoribosyltransferase
MSDIMLKTDFYKIGHHLCFPKDTQQVYSNLTPRSGKGQTGGVVFFGLQYLIKRFLIEEFDAWFNLSKEEAVGHYKRIIDNGLGGDNDVSHIARLHDLGYLPLKIKALPEGTIVPHGIPCLTITNTIDEFYWLPNFLETLISNTLWYPSTSANHARKLKNLVVEYANKTCEDAGFCDFQLHDFSYRGHHSSDSGMVYGAAWLTSFKGSDTVPSIPWLEKYYNGTDIAYSVVASEHSQAMSFGKDNELDYIKHMINIVPKGIVSIVADTWNYPRFMTKLLPQLKDMILNREGCVVVRPDTFWTTPQDCICGYDGYHEKMDSLDEEEKEFIKMGSVEYLYKTFGGTINSKGYKEVNSKVNVLYGEAWFEERLKDAYERLMNKGFATKFVAGVGSWTALNCNRDLDNWAIKATAVKRNGVWHNIFKDPITDKGFKKSACGMLYVGQKDGQLFVEDQVSPEKEATGLLTEVFKNGRMVVETSLQEIRERVKNEKA